MWQIPDKLFCAPGRPTAFQWVQGRESCPAAEGEGSFDPPIQPLGKPHPEKNCLPGAGLPGCFYAIQPHPRSQQYPGGQWPRRQIHQAFGSADAGPFRLKAGFPDTAKAVVYAGELSVASSFDPKDPPLFPNSRSKMKADLPGGSFRLPGACPQAGAARVGRKPLQRMVSNLMNPFPR